jgi:hypothetical protein
VCLCVYRKGSIQTSTQRNFVLAFESAVRVARSAYPTSLLERCSIGQSTINQQYFLSSDEISSKLFRYRNKNVLLLLQHILDTIRNISPFDVVNSFLGFNQTVDLEKLYSGSCNPIVNDTQNAQSFLRKVKACRENEEIIRSSIDHFKETGKLRLDAGAANYALYRSSLSTWQEEILPALYIYKQINGETSSVPKDFIVPGVPSWPINLHGLALGNLVEASKAHEESIKSRIAMSLLQDWFNSRCDSIFDLDSISSVQLIMKNCDMSSITMEKLIQTRTEMIESLEGSLSKYDFILIILSDVIFISTYILDIAIQV